MKPLLSCLMLLLVGFASSSLYAQYPEVENEEWRKNKIKTTTDVTYSCHLDAHKNDLYAIHSRGYDSRGNLIYDSYRGRELEDTLRVTAYKYDDKNNAIEETRDGNVVRRSEYTYDNTGHVTKRTIWNHGIRQQHEFTLNDKGKVLEDTCSCGRRTERYNAAGNVAEAAEFNQDGSQFVKETYNDKGDMTEAVVYGHGDPRGHLYHSARTVYTYDEAGHITKEEEYDSSGHLSLRTVYMYDEAGHRSEELEYGSNGDTLFQRSTFKYDEKGLVIESSQFNAKGECADITMTTYRFYP
jgi:hypothetical protein